MSEQNPAENISQSQAPPGPVRRFFRNLGPGLITGAADDDPSGISTYATAGAAFGYGMLWTAWFSLPLMAAVQLMCARIGMVSGRSLAAVLRHYYSRRVLLTFNFSSKNFHISCILHAMACFRRRLLYSTIC